MKRRNMGGIPKVRVSFGEKDAGPRSSLHRRMGIKTFTPPGRDRLRWRFDRQRGVYYSPHEYRARVTLPKVFEK